MLVAEDYRTSHFSSPLVSAIFILDPSEYSPSGDLPVVQVSKFQELANTFRP